MVNISKFIAACILALGFALACAPPFDGPSGPTLPSGGRWVNFTEVPSEGPFVFREGIFAATSTAELEAAVLASGYVSKGQCPSPCWRIYQPDQPGLLYLALGTRFDTCDHDVKERAAIGDRTLHFIHWVGGPNGTRCGDAAAVRRWRLVSISRRDLPGAGTLTVRFETQGYYGTSSFESQVQLT